ncbi:MAG: MBL fold hydrolase [Firmicutes bacterium HGW-Firmicutes-16]|nr:MAG: MBL fold hydrolase [Firmicutes bacterium HGW-Firmicutes-16]
MKITALIENKAPEGLKSEHGLCLLAEYGSKTFLLDTGASNTFASNAQKLGVDLAKVDAAVLSHAHFDHSGGYNAFFAANSAAKVYLREGSRELCYVKIGPYKRYVGIPRGILDKYADRIIYVSKDKEISEGVWLIGHSTSGLEKRGRLAHLYRKTSSGLVPDDFAHEQSLVFDTADGLVILNSCCHGGADNIVAEVKKALPNHEVAAIIGGFHLMGVRGTKTLGVKPQEVEDLGRRLPELGVKHTYVCHCTGDPANKILTRVMGENVSYLRTGTVIEF